MTSNGSRKAAIPGWLDSLPIGVAVFAADARLLFANPRFFALLCLHEPQPILADLDELLATVRRESVEAAALLAGQFVPNPSGVASVRWAHGDTVIDIASAAMADGGRSVTLADVSALAAAEREASGQAAALRAVLEAVPHGICVYGPDRRVRQLNRTYRVVMQGAPVEVGDHLEDVIRRRTAAGEYGPGAPDEIADQQRTYFAELPLVRRRRRPNGTIIDIRTAALPDGGHVSVVTDVTALTEAEAESLRRSEEMAAMLASIRHGILLWGPDRRLVACNAIAADLFDHPQGLLVPGRSEDELLDHMQLRGDLGSGEQGREAIRRLRELDRSVPYVRESLTRTGRAVEIRSDPTPTGGWVTTFSDVTAARQAELAARHAKEAAEAASQAKSRFLATMSHELRTPLNAVIGFSEALLREAANPSPDRVAEFARQINESGRGLLELINIILDVASIESGRFSVAAEPVDVTRLIRSAVRQVDALAQAAEISVTTEIRKPLPALRGDQRRLLQVLNHLLSNAVKFTDAGGTITIGARREKDGGVLISVSDTGMGIAPEDLERVFDPFTQIDAALSRRFQGAGLGLYVSRALVEGHGGRLSLHSRLGEGTTAEIRLPAR